jgi:hypothetical protein
MEDIDIWRAAEQMRQQFGADAAIQAAMRADKFMAQGDLEGARTWRRVIVAIDELDRTMPGGDDVRH